MLTENLKTFADSKFSLRDIELKQKRVIGENSREGQFEKRREEKRRESRQTISFASFNYKILAKISERDFIKYRRWSILESGKLFCFPRKASKCYPFYVSKISIVSDLLI